MPVAKGTRGTVEPKQPRSNKTMRDETEGERRKVCLSRTKGQVLGHAGLHTRPIQDPPFDPGPLPNLPACLPHCSTISASPSFPRPTPVRSSTRKFRLTPLFFLSARSRPPCHPRSHQSFFWPQEYLPSMQRLLMNVSSSDIILIQGLRAPI